MKNTIGKRIREARNALDISQAKLADLIGVDQSTVAQWELDRTSPRPKVLLQLAKVLYLEPEFLQFGVTDSAGGAGGSPVKVVGYVGGGSEVRSFEGKGHPPAEAPPKVADGSADVTAAIVVRGNTMWPTYRDGDILYYLEGGKKKPSAMIGTECVLEIEGQGKVVKRLMSGSKAGLFTLASYNAPEERDVPVVWAAPIVWVRRNLSSIK